MGAQLNFDSAEVPMTEIPQYQQKPEFDYDEYTDGGLFGDIVTDERDTALETFLTGKGYKAAKDKEGFPTATSTDVGYVLVGADGEVITEPNSKTPKIFPDLMDMPKGARVQAVLVDDGKNKFFRVNDGSKNFQKAVVRGDQTEIISGFKDKYKTPQDPDGFENIEVDAQGKATFKKIDEATFPKNYDKESVTFLDKNTILVNGNGKNYVVSKAKNPELFKTLSTEHKASLGKQMAAQKERLEQALDTEGASEDLDPDEIAEQLGAELAGPIKDQYKTNEKENPTSFSKDIKFLAADAEGNLIVDEATGKPKLFDRKDLPEGSTIKGVSWTDAQGGKHVKVHDGENTDDFVQTVLQGDKHASLGGAKLVPDNFDKATIKTVAFVDGNTLLVTDSAGNKYEVSRFDQRGPTLFDELIADAKYKSIYNDGLAAHKKSLGEQLGGTVTFTGTDYKFTPSTAA
jgi:hypothetical protein